MHEFAAVDALAGDPHILGGSTGAFKGSLGLDTTLKAAPWYLPSRSSILASSDTSREGQSYAQKRSLRFGLGKDLALGSDKAGDSFSCDVSWEPSWDYTRKLLCSTVEERSTLRLARNIRGSLTAEHTLSWVRQRQRAGDELLYLFPDDPSRELEVPEVPDSDSLYSLLCLQYRWEQPVRSTRRKLGSLLPGSGKPPPIVHEENVRIENQIVLTDRARSSLTGTVPLRLGLMHKSSLIIQEGVQLEMEVKTFGGVEELIEHGHSLYRSALGFELRLGALLTF
jgi:hypothetical protein